MRKVMLLTLGMLMAFAVPLFAEDAKVIGLTGKVMVKVDAASGWEKATVNMTLGKGAQVQTKRDAQCTLAFDAKGKNVVTVKNRSDIKVESVKPGKVFLSSGRVFALIKDASETKKFEVRTPTAISGARGTGWLTEYVNGKTSVQVFDDEVFVFAQNNQPFSAQHADARVEFFP